MVWWCYHICCSWLQWNVDYHPRRTPRAWSSRYSTSSPIEASVFAPDNHKYCWEVIFFGPTNAPPFYSDMGSDLKDEWDKLSLYQTQTTQVDLRWTHQRHWLIRNMAWRSQNHTWNTGYHQRYFIILQQSYADIAVSLMHLHYFSEITS